MMRSGPIQPEQVEHTVDRGAEVLALWENGPGGTPDLPWQDASQFDRQTLGHVVAGASTLSLVVGTTPASRALLDAVLDTVRPPCRLYVYGDRALEADSALARRLGTLSDRVLVRLGHRPPADWVVAEGGRDGLLLVGPSAAVRRWAVPVDGPLARSVFEAFRHLFWFHAAREALPDASGAVAFRNPLPAPYDRASDDLPLPSGRLTVGGSLVDPVPDAEIRVSPVHADPGRARVIFVPPADGTVNGGAGAPTSFDVPRSLAGRGHSVVWTDLGVPRTTVTRQRFVMDLVEAPIALQLEWSRGAAVDLFHRLDRASAAPVWSFHPSRPLRAIRAAVLTENATKEQQVQARVTIDAGRVTAPLLDFDTARPPRLPDAPQLALEVNYRWTRVPTPLPPGARPAELVRAWTAVDEWASRAVDDCRRALDKLDEQEGLLGRLRRWLPSRDEAVLERRRLRDEVDELGEARPSQAPDQAGERLRRIQSAATRLNSLLGSTHASRQAAEDAQAEEAQRDAWQSRVEAAREKLTVAREKLGANEAAQARAQADVQAAESVLAEAVEALWGQRTARLATDRQELQAELDAAKAAQDELESKHGGRPPKAERKEAGRRVHQAEQALAQNGREAAATASWTPSPNATADESKLLADARGALARLRAESNALGSEVKALERAADEAFRFEPPARLRAPALLDVPAPPPTPKEAPPELGDLYEHERRRFLAIKTWEQLRRAEPVARRLQAELVVAPPPSK
jgi:hypothetical protein